MLTGLAVFGVLVVAFFFFRSPSGGRLASNLIASGDDLVDKARQATEPDPVKAMERELSRIEPLKATALTAVAERATDEKGKQKAVDRLTAQLATEKREFNQLKVLPCKDDAEKAQRDGQLRNKFKRVKGAQDDLALATKELDTAHLSAAAAREQLQDVTDQIEDLDRKLKANKSIQNQTRTIAAINQLGQLTDQLKRADSTFDKAHEENARRLALEEAKRDLQKPADDGTKALKKASEEEEYQQFLKNS